MVLDVWEKAPFSPRLPRSPLPSKRVEATLPSPRETAMKPLGDRSLELAQGMRCAKLPLTSV
jgi:hypothetical protein